MYAMTEVVCEILPETNLVIWWVWELNKYFGKHSFGSWHVWLCYALVMPETGCYLRLVRLILK
jgi:hypothetical protein